MMSETVVFPKPALSATALILTGFFWVRSGGLAIIEVDAKGVELECTLR